MKLKTKYLREINAACAALIEDIKSMEAVDPKERSTKQNNELAAVRTACTSACLLQSVAQRAADAGVSDKDLADLVSLVGKVEVVEAPKKKGKK